jgi:hypothetical protein
VLAKPPNIANDEFKSAKWDEITAGRDFAPSDAPTLALLCQWHKVAQQAMDELDNFGSQTAYQNDMGDLKAFPQIETLKKCSNEIRQLNKQLGICDSHEKEEVASGKRPATVLSIVTSKRAERRTGTA